MTATIAAPLDNLAQQIARQQAELEALRREYETRQAHLTDLTRRREELTAQLQQVEADIQATSQGGVPRSASARPQAPPAQPTQTLPALLVELVQQATGPMTVKQLADEVQRRRFPTTSGNVPKLVGIKVGLLINKGLLRRAPNKAGVLPARPGAGAKTAPGKATRGARKSGKNGAVDAQPKPAAKAGGRRGQPPLRVLLANLLAKTRRPLAARELADQVLAGGYRTKSKNFVDVLWVALGHMDNVENVPGQGYRLKTGSR
jgi:hypothetical protein